MSNETEYTTTETASETEEAGEATVRRDWHDSDRPSVPIAEGVATATDRAVTDLPPLHRVVDPDALDKVLTDGQSSDVVVSFDYSGTVVSVAGDGSVVERE